MKTLIQTPGGGTVEVETSARVVRRDEFEIDVERNRHAQDAAAFERGTQDSRDQQEHLAKWYPQDVAARPSTGGPAPDMPTSGRPALPSFTNAHAELERHRQQQGSDPNKSGANEARARMLARYQRAFEYGETY